MFYPRMGKTGNQSACSAYPYPTMALAARKSSIKFIRAKMIVCAGVKYYKPVLGQRLTITKREGRYVKLCIFIKLGSAGARCRCGKKRD
jgi:hypothetical protein